MLQSFRLGFATNSSSAHSIILHSDPKYLGMLSDDGIGALDGYGRDNYTFTEPKTKLAYMIWAHQRAGRANMSAHHKINIMKEFPDLITDFNASDFDDIFTAVQAYDPEGGVPGEILCPDNIPLQNWFEFIINGPVAIHGWDDNGEPSFEKVNEKDNGHAAFGYSMRWKFDGQAIIGYSPDDGTKFRWSKAPYSKSTTPELVDLKITDYCGYGCKFCYQGSTKEGQHAPIKRLKSIIETLGQNGTFELAIGGGEPVDHPDFGQVFHIARDNKITVNFTSYGVDWASDKDHPVVKAMKDTRWSGGIGVSVHTKRDIEKVTRLSNALSGAGIWGAQVMAQTVIGATSVNATFAILEDCIKEDRPLLLLGYKTTGRGKTFAQRKRTEDEVKKLLKRAKAHIEAPLEEDRWGYTSKRKFTLSVDTAFLDVYGHLLDEMNVPVQLRTSPEGKFSMYIDGVENTAAPSSYCDTDQIVEWDPSKLKDIFAQF